MSLIEETELDTPEVDTSSHFGNTRSRCIKQYPELGTPDLSTPELDTTSLWRQRRLNFYRILITSTVSRLLCLLPVKAVTGGMDCTQCTRAT